MKIVILIFILPQEISELQTILHTFNNSQKLLSGKFDWTIDVCMSFSSDLIDWHRSLLKKEFFDEKLYNLNNRTNWCETDFYSSDKIRGALEYRRSMQDKYSDSDYIIMIDSDMIFPNETLNSFENAIKKLHNETPYLQITPEVTKLWGNPWDSITNENYLDEDNKFFRRCDPYLENGIKGDISYEQVDARIKDKPDIPRFIWGCGWFTCLSTKLFNLVKLPNSFAPYGPDDVFFHKSYEVMLKYYGYDIRQYKIKNLVVCEMNKYRNNKEYTNFMKYYHRKNEYKEVVRTNMQSEIDNLLNNN